jgi:sialic acid synthase SpsE
MNPFIIADVGSNWRRYEDTDKNKECALNHIREAAKCGVSAVKFQYFTHKELYGTEGDDTFSLPRAWLQDLKDECDRNKVEFMCTPFSREAVWTIDPLVKRHKVASCEMQHPGILEAIKKTRKPMIVSTGAANDQEVRYLISQWKPDVIMECVAAYPAKPSDYDLRYIRCIKALFEQQVGLSDHTLTNSLALTAVGMGCTYFEKHFYVDPYAADCFAVTPDYGHSLGTQLLSEYVESIREGFSSLGDGQKRPRDSEMDIVKYYRRRDVVINNVTGLFRSKPCK